MYMIRTCIECGLKLRDDEEDDLLCASCNAKIENDIRIIKEDEILPEDVFQVI